ncbi:MAG: HD domain-containing protein [Syntrophomonas sp.]|uniref:3'-5' exoribonuclease YhaM family protein n=1 Tax=Syntrophomonas sp. TaxID=2053627 RepID=UPI00261E0F9C|nr:HD domain-containing protein [Syntrophomonas sp.]MDD2509519.1 HD domain-containing protein [Syntrophomonas sp.]MDD3878390.1 HD domain-containing protein [Syntrophomonas sp.]MDD4625511.1 HD domain-containing protein [Syntrophomonas sp.]
MEKKGPFTVKELKALPPGTQFWGKYLIIGKNQRKTKDGREIIDLRIADSSGEIYSVVWDSCSIHGELETGLVIGLLGDIGIYNQRLQVIAKRIKILDEDQRQYLRMPLTDMEQLVKEFDQILNSIADPNMKELLQRVFNPEIRARFFQAPAAKKIHHNYYGGLLEHSLSVAGLCNKAADSYPGINRDLLLTGALLHDIGKLVEYEMDVAPRYTPEGRLLGHIVLGNEMVAARINEMKNEGIEFPLELEWMIKHMLVSHHGSLEYGSPVLPLFTEAYILYAMDNLDARVFVFKNKIEEGDGDEEYFSKYDSFYGQHFFTFRLA